MRSSGKLKRVAVGLSGGVDSSIAAYLLKKAGYEVVGVYMRCWDEKADGCTASADKASAVRVASKLDIKFTHLNFIKEYKERVINYFYKEYSAGKTPNPDIMCNKEIKFGMFLDWALFGGFDYVATGHYVRVEKSGAEYCLKQGKDESKDQSYFLYLLNQSRLSKVLFPLGNLTKVQVRKLAKKIGLHTYNRPDSMGICFIGNINVQEFLKRRIPVKPGNVVDTLGNVIGRHEGVFFYTVGQRHGFSVNKYVGLPLYVIGKNIEKNELIVGFVKDVLKTEFNVRDLRWISANYFSGNINCHIRVRHLGDFYPGTVKPKPGNLAEVAAKNKIFGIAPGQSAVFYNKDVVLGGGIISG